MRCIDCWTSLIFVSFLQVRKLVVRLTTHVRIEAMKDGLTEEDLRKTLEQGEEIEDYPEWIRALLLGWTEEHFPCHIVKENTMSKGQKIPKNVKRRETPLHGKPVR